MEKIETEFDEYGWKLLIRKSKEGVITISQRSRSSEIHMMHKPMELRLQPEDFVKLKRLIKEISRKDEDK